MNKGLDLKSIKPNALVSIILKRYGKHVGFAALIVVLLTYVFVVVKISSLSRAEPAPSQTVNSSNLVPHVNQQAIDRIQALENNSPQIHSLFEQARNNPFQE
jgi:predicted PurR-regulated permease PerM